MISDVIDSFANDDGQMVVTRRVPGTYVNGILVPGAVIATFPLVAVVQPATGQQRIVGGLDMRGWPEGTEVEDNRVIMTYTELLPRTPTQEPDAVTLEGRTWFVFRCEPWNLNGDKTWRVTIVKITGGAS